jgi:hypothetical protein
MRSMELLGFADDLIADEDLDLAVGALSGYRLEARFLWSVRIDALDVSLEPAHEKEQPEDREGPHGQHDQQRYLVARHVSQFLRA